LEASYQPSSDGCKSLNRWLLCDFCRYNFLNDHIFIQTPTYIVLGT
jgi:hypothetical protein